MYTVLHFDKICIVVNHVYFYKKCIIFEKVLYDMISTSRPGGLLTCDFGLYSCFYPDMHQQEKVCLWQKPQTEPCKSIKTFFFPSLLSIFHPALLLLVQLKFSWCWPLAMFLLYNSYKSCFQVILFIIFCKVLFKKSQSHDLEIIALS